jgi:hypothetical protein
VLLMRQFVVGFMAAAISLSFGCAKSPSGIYIARERVFGIELTHEIDFREDGTCYYSFDGKRSLTCTWSKRDGVIEVRHKNEVKYVESDSEIKTKLKWDGTDLVPAPGESGQSMRFVKR